MAQAYRPTALVVEDDVLQRSLVTLLLEESNLRVVACDCAEDAIEALDRLDAQLVMLFTDVDLGGSMDGIELAHIVKKKFPHVHLIVTSGTFGSRRLPNGTTFMAKPWAPMQLLREAARTN